MSLKRGKASRPGTCQACKGPIVRGDRVVYTSMAHANCVGGGFTTVPPAPTLEFTLLQALDALEETVQVAAQVNGVSDELERQWARYEKLKALGLQPGTTHEGRLAMKSALVELVKMAF